MFLPTPSAVFFPSLRDNYTVASVLDTCAEKCRVTLTLVEIRPTKHKRISTGFVIERIGSL